MINFFRKTRKKMADDNKPMKYMRYAIGEIVLVVIGILIALQINNWNEDRKLEKLKQQLFVELKASIMSDTVSLNLEKSRLKSALINAKLLKKKISLDSPYTPELDSSFAKIELVRISQANYKILDRILDIGIEIIDDNTLKNELLHYYEDSKNLSNAGNKVTKLLSEQIYPKHFISYNRSKSAVPDDFERLKNLNEFKIAIDYCIETSSFLIERSIHRKILAINILGVLDDHIIITKDDYQKMPYIKTMVNDTMQINESMEKILENN